jgi:hypothetical protein
MDEFARRGDSDRRAYFEEAARRRDLTPIILEKDFWVCWTLRRLVRHPDLAGHITFKGGTSLSKAYGIIQRFSEDIDLTIRRTAAGLSDLASPMDEGISGKERVRRTEAIKAGARAFVGGLAHPGLQKAIADALDTTDGWTLELDPEDGEGQTILFHYPGADRSSAKAYIKPSIKLEFGARGDPEPFKMRPITPYVAEEFPDEFSDPGTAVETLRVERTYWEKATILHALHHNGKFRAGLSRHYYDLLMLDGAGVTPEAIAQAPLLARVVQNKMLLFTDRSASYETAVLPTLRLVPTDAFREALRTDYAAMSDMFMAQPPSFAQLLGGLTALQERLNGS